MTLSQLRGASQLGGAAWGSGATQHLSRVASLEDWSGSSEVPRFWGALGGPWQRGAEHGAGMLCAPLGCVEKGALPAQRDRQHFEDSRFNPPLAQTSLALCQLADAARS